MKIRKTSGKMSKKVNFQYYLAFFYFLQTDVILANLTAFVNIYGCKTLKILVLLFKALKLPI